MIFKNSPENYHLIVPSKALLATKVLKSPAAMAKGSLSYVLISNLSEKPIKIKPNALVAHLIAQNPASNMHFVEMGSKEEINKMEEKDYVDEEELIGDRIYIPAQQPTEDWTKDQIKEHLQEQNQHLQDDQKTILEELVFKFRSLFATNPNKPGLQTKTQMHVRFTEGMYVSSHEISALPR